ncbi:MAG: hypothetical protein CMJ78_22935 [Planctomycetaceae bacterium]|nr:hypothetical protein [Planctomycetaceae bacterium]
MLRMSLILSLLVASGPLAFAQDGETPPAQEEAVKTLRGKASNIQKNRNGTVRFVRFSKPIVTDEHLQHITVFEQLDYLAVVTSAVTDKGLANITGLTNLDSLVLTHTQLTDSGLDLLQGSREKLELLYLDRTKVTSAGLEKLKGLSALRILWLENNEISNTGIEHLAGLKALEVLNLSGTNVDDEVLELLAKLPKLMGLYLDRTQVTGRGLEKLAALKELEFVSLAGTPIDKKHLQQFKKFPALKQVNLYSTSLVQDDLAGLSSDNNELRFALSRVFGDDQTPFQRFMSGKKLRGAPRSPTLQIGKADGVDAGAKIEDVQVALDKAPDFQRHIVPLLGTLGCNGRACHGSFQGQGGFSLSMFGYDFEADLKEMMEDGESRINLKDPQKSLIIRKPSGQEDHGGDQRFEENGWEHKALEKWIANGAKGKPELDKLVRFEVSPAELVFAKTDDTVQLKVIATWQDGTREDVTKLARFEVKDDQVATVERGGLVTCKSAGDTHVLAMYDKGVFAAPVMIPVSDKTGGNFPTVPTPTKIDELVVDKLSKLGIVPSELCSDTDYLRRVYLDMAGTLPAPREIKAFLEDKSPSKREAVIDRLLESEAYATWWGLWLADLTGSNTSVLGGTDINWAGSAQWQAWLKQRVKDNDGWDKTTAAILLARSRQPNQSYDEYAAVQSKYLARKDPLDAKTFDFPMHYYWFHGMRQQPIDRALSIGYVFMGVRLQCAQCHKHPFDQWSKQDFDQFSNFFTRMRTGQNSDAALPYRMLRERLGVPKKLDTAALRRQMYMRVYAEGLPIPYVEVVINPNGENETPARLPGGKVFDLGKYPDPREPLVEWLLRKDNPYFARSFVNRIWARYFGSGIVDPPDDFNMGNPPTNAPLLDWLASAFVENGYDMKWLHKAIASSRTYQLSSETNKTNANDTRHFSHARLRRLQAEIIVDGMLQATNNDGANRNGLSYMQDRRIAKHPGTLTPRANEYALMVFGKPTRSTNCDCERRVQPTLLQSLYTRNDAELLEWVERSNGWVAQVANHLKAPLAMRDKPEQTIKAQRGARDPIPAEVTAEYLVEEAWLRSLSRMPTDAEVERTVGYLKESENLAEGLRDVMWALLNTQEFLTNH